MARKKIPPASRYLSYRRWAAGRHHAYRPSMADLWALATGLGSEPPVMIVPRMVWQA